MSKLTPEEHAALAKRLGEITAKAQATNLTLVEWSELQKERESLARKVAIDDRARK